MSFQYAQGKGFSSLIFDVSFATSEDINSTPETASISPISVTVSFTDTTYLINSRFCKISYICEKKTLMTPFNY